MTESEAREKLRRWASAFLAAKDNPQEMLAGHMDTTEAARRMRVMHDAEQRLWEIPDDVLPEPLRKWKKANSDPGCSRCWLSSRKDTWHPDCGKKIKEWFDARDALVKWILEELDV